MKFADLFPTNYLSQDDIPVPVNMTIDRIAIEEIGGNREKEDKPVVYFQRCSKGLVLNRTNGEMLTECFGDDVSNWIGKTVQIYVDPNVKMAGKRTGGIRLRPVIAGLKGNGPALSWSEAVKYASDNGMSEQQLKDTMKSEGVSVWVPSVCTQMVFDAIDRLRNQKTGDSSTVKAEEQIPF